MGSMMIYVLKSYLHIHLAWQDPPNFPPVRLETSDLEDFWFVLLHALAGYSYPRRKQRDAGKIQGVMSHRGRWSMPTFSSEDWYTCYLVCTKYDILYILYVLQDCWSNLLSMRFSWICFIWDSSMPWRGAWRYWLNNRSHQCLGSLTPDSSET